jgi:hypothetical protein
LGLEIVCAGALPEGGYGRREDPTFSCATTCRGTTYCAWRSSAEVRLPSPLPSSPLEQQTLVHRSKLTPHGTLHYPLSVKAGIDVRAILDFAEEL